MYIPNAKSINSKTDPQPKQMTGAELHEIMRQKLAELGISVVRESEAESTKDGDSWWVEVHFVWRMEE